MADVEWIEEEIEIPGANPNLPPGFSRDDSNTPKVTQRVAYAPLVPYVSCTTHYFIFKNNGQRENGHMLIQCKHCPLGKIFVPGKHELQDGKLITLDK